MDVVISFAQYVPPAGTIRRRGEDPVMFTGRLGLLQAIDDVLARGISAASAGPVVAQAGQFGSELDPGAQAELAQHMRDVGGDRVARDDQPGGDLGIGQALPG